MRSKTVGEGKIGQSMRLASLFAVVLMMMMAFLVKPATSHELSAAVMTVEFKDTPTRLSGEIEMNLEAFIVGIGPEHDDTDDSPEAALYKQYRDMSPAELTAAFDALSQQFSNSIFIEHEGERLPVQVSNPAVPAVGDVQEARLSRVTVVTDVPPGVSALQVGWAAGLGQLIVRTAGGGDDGYAAILSGGELSASLSITGTTQQSFWATLVDFIGTGFDHIIPQGLDHILFVVGLFLLSTSLPPLLWQISAFTLAHTITLAMGMLGILNIPGSIVEPIIAASIVYVAVENILSPEMTRWRPLLVFIFGLLHGLGFAGVLTEYGMPAGQFVEALIGFNIGVELGQLTVIAICFMLVGFWFGKKPWYRKNVVIPGSLIVALVGLYWVVERTIL